ncbi:fatty acid elongase [Cladochytrium replicatum]|nr:fatty acid elongase [Cladochytrium replicatum]
MDAEIARSFPLGFLYPILVSWEFPIFTSAAYFFIVKAVNPPPRPKGTPAPKEEKNSALFTAFVFLHNLALFVFSAATFLSMTPVVLRNFSSKSYTEALCDKEGDMWTSGLFKWSWLFYLSKYYEIMDTVILLVKGKRTSLLQSYHHAGAIISMWLGVRSRATAIWIFVVFNSFIHTLMYFYYALTTIHIRPPSLLKQSLTRLQISQFLIGGSLATSYLFVPQCMKQQPGLLLSEMSAYYVNVSYLVPLTWLFIDFFKQSYNAKGAKSGTKKIN